VSDHVAIGDVCEVIAGQSPPGSAYNSIGEGLPFYQGKKQFGDRWLQAPTTWTTQSTKRAREGDVLMSVRAPVGPVNVATQEACIGRGLAAIRADRMIDEAYLYYALRGLEPTIRGSAGAVFTSINKAQIQSLQVRLPPLDEQRRIVAKLDAISAQVAAATENRKAKALALKAARSALLQQLCMEPPPGAAVSEWERVPLDEVCLKIQDGAHRSPQTLHEEPGLGRYLYLTSKNIRNDGLNLERVQYCEADFHDEIFRRCNPERGDVLLTKDGANTGNVALNTLDEPFSLLSSVCLLKPEHSKLDGRFLRYYLRSADGLDQVTGRMTGAAIPRIILKTIKSCQIPLPPLDEQRRIVAKLDETTAAIDALESGVDSAAQELDALTASVLSNLLAAST